MRSDVVFVVEIDGSWTVSHDANVIGSYRCQIEAIDAARLVASDIDDCRILVQPKVYPSQADWAFEDPCDIWDIRERERAAEASPLVPVAVDSVSEKTAKITVLP